MVDTRAQTIFNPCTQPTSSLLVNNIHLDIYLQVSQKRQQCKSKEIAPNERDDFNKPDSQDYIKQYNHIFYGQYLLKECQASQTSFEKGREQPFFDLMKNSHFESVRLKDYETLVHIIIHTCRFCTPFPPKYIIWPIKVTPHPFTILVSSPNSKSISPFTFP